MSAENIQRSLQVATLGIGNGRNHFAESLRTHAEVMGIPSETQDLLAHLSIWERLMLHAGYDFLSKCPPRLYKFLRSAYGESGPKSVDPEGVKNIFKHGCLPISVTPVTAAMLSEAGVPYIQMVGDRIVQTGDTSSGAKMIAIPSREVTDVQRLNGTRIVDIGGVVQPASLAQIVPNDRRKEFESDAIPHVLFSVNGAGDMGRVKYILQQLWPLVEKNIIRLSIFAGYKKRIIRQIQYEIDTQYLPDYKWTDPHLPSKRVVNLYFTDNKAEAIILRMNLLPQSHFVIPASPMELVNGPWLVPLDRTTARNVGEEMNFDFAIEHGWAIDGGQNFSNLGFQIEKLLDTNNGTREAMQMYDAALRHNDPKAGERLLMAWLSEVGR